MRFLSTDLSPFTPTAFATLYTRMAARIITLSKTSTTFPSEVSKNVLMVSVWMLVSIPESEHALVTRWGIIYIFTHVSHPVPQFLPGNVLLTAFLFR